MKPKRRCAAPVRRYCARAYASGSKVLELGVDTDLEKLVARARRHYERSGQRTWVWSLRTGLTVFEIGAGSSSLRRVRLSLAGISG
jgi:hypothetical protein